MVAALILKETKGRRKASARGDVRTGSSRSVSQLAAFILLSTSVRAADRAPNAMLMYMLALFLE